MKSTSQSRALSSCREILEPGALALLPLAFPLSSRASRNSSPMTANGGTDPRLPSADFTFRTLVGRAGSGGWLDDQARREHYDA